MHPSLKSLTKDPFDISDVSDLPEEIRPKRAPGQSKSRKALALLQAAGRPVSTAELSVAMFRVHGIRAPVLTICAQLLDHQLHAGRVRRVAPGVYEAVQPQKPAR